MTEDIFHLGIKALIQNNNGEILLLKVNPDILTENEHGAYWDIPGGRIQKGDDVEETLKREIEEETQIKTIKSIKPFDMVLSNIRIPTENGSVGLILSTYLCTIKDNPTIQLSEEHIEAKWFLPKEATKLLETKYPKEFVDKVKRL